MSKYVNQDGTVNTAALEALEEDLKAVTDHLTSLDKIFAKAKLGIDMELVFQCGESGLYYPQDYIKQWGRLYGIGLGPHPVSESLQSEYEVAPPDIRGLKSIHQIMHPMRVSCAQMDMMEVASSAVKENSAVLDMDDRDYEIRAQILRNKQLDNPLGRVKMYEVAWVQAGRKT